MFVGTFQGAPIHATTIVAIYRPDGVILSGSCCNSRKAARAWAVQYTGASCWGQLWRRGWRVMSVME
jgi:hypothetical protein